jgi:hypothetical protein
LTDGSTGVSLVASHCLVDGLGGFAGVADAVNGNLRDLGYPPPRSRTRLRAAASDARETLQGAPEVARALRGAAKLLWNRRHDIARPATARPAAIVGEGADRIVVVPGITVYVDLDDWDARTNSLGGNSHSLLAGFAAKLGERLGRWRTDDGTVTLLAPISDRTKADTRAIAMSYVRVGIDPTQVTTDLSGVRDAFRQGVKTVRDAPDQTGQLLACTAASGETMGRGPAAQTPTGNSEDSLLTSHNDTVRCHHAAAM